LYGKHGSSDTFNGKDGTGEWSELLDGSYAANRAALNAPFIGEEKKE
jgi:hypothetical protein